MHENRAEDRGIVYKALRGISIKRMSPFENPFVELMDFATACARKAPALSAKEEETTFPTSQIKNVIGRIRKNSRVDREV